MCIGWVEVALHRQEDEEIDRENVIAIEIDEEDDRVKEDEGILRRKILFLFLLLIYIMQMKFCIF